MNDHEGTTGYKRSKIFWDHQKIADVGAAMRVIAAMASRTLWSAVALLSYTAFNATPDDTLYGLAQTVHQASFWWSAAAIAAAYSVVLSAIHKAIRPSVGGLLCGATMVGGACVTKQGIPGRHKGFAD